MARSCEAAKSSKGTRARAMSGERSRAKSRAHREARAGAGAWRRARARARGRRLGVRGRSARACRRGEPSRSRGRAGRRAPVRGAARARARASSYTCVRLARGSLAGAGASGRRRRCFGFRHHGTRKLCRAPAGSRTAGLPEAVGVKSSNGRRHVRQYSSRSRGEEAIGDVLAASPRRGRARAPGGRRDPAASDAGRVRGDHVRARPCATSSGPWPPSARRVRPTARVDTRVEVCTASPARGWRERRRGSRVRATTTVETPFDDNDALFVRLATAAADGRGATSHHATTPRGVAGRFDARVPPRRPRRVGASRARGRRGARRPRRRSAPPARASLSGSDPKAPPPAVAARWCAPATRGDGVAGVAAGISPGPRGGRRDAPARDGAGDRAPRRARGRVARGRGHGRVRGASPRARRAAPRASARNAWRRGGWRACRGASAGGPGTTGRRRGAPRLGRRGDCAPSETSPGWGSRSAGDAGTGSPPGRTGTGTGRRAAAGGRSARPFAFGGGFANQRTIIPGIVFTRDETARSWDAAFACKVLFDVAS